MALKNVHSDLPAGGGGDGFPPDEIPRFGLSLVQAWADTDIPDGEKPHAIEGTSFRLSWAGKCARDLGYWMMGLTPSNPLDLADYWRMGLGTMVHEHLQSMFTTAFPGASIEHKVDLRELDEPVDGSGHIDIYIAKQAVHAPADPIPLRERSTVIEVKTMNGFGFKRAIGARGPAEGPRSNALRQGALEAYAVDADELVILYLALELLSPDEFKRFGGVHEAQKFLAEWTYTREQYQPIAKTELRRVAAIQELVDKGVLPPRSIPDLPPKSRITDPARGDWQLLDEAGQIVNMGNYWMCKYCGNQDRCIEDGPS